MEGLLNAGDSRLCSEGNGSPRSVESNPGRGPLVVRHEQVMRALDGGMSAIHNAPVT